MSFDGEGRRRISTLVAHPRIIQRRPVGRIARLKRRTPRERISPQGKAEPFDIKSFSSTLSFYRSQGQTPLPHAPSQLPASEVARLKKQARPLDHYMSD